MKAAEVRKKFIEFFESKKHVFVPSSPLFPQGDPTLLFVNAGMNQFKDIFLGNEEPKSPRAANSQKCLRASGKHNDLEDVGYDTYHHTFFEMLGNWSFGDYYKKEAIAWAWELFTDVFQLPKDKLYATVYRTDDEAFDLWKEITDIKPEHILRFDEKDNFWEMGETGPCGPCSEIHIDLGPEACDRKGVEGHVCGVNGDCGRYIELWNLVFVQYNRIEGGDLKPLEKTHVDTGAGLERLVSVLQGKHSNYDTDLFLPILKKLEEETGKRYEGKDAIAMRVVSDHIRTLTFAITDGIIPSNEGRGYVIRRILRRAYRYGRSLGYNKPFLYQLMDVVVDLMKDAYPELEKARENTKKMIKMEEERFAQTLDKGLDLFEKVAADISGKTFPGKEAFTLYDTYGFPVDLTALLCRERGLEVDMDAFEAAMEKQKQQAREAGKFKGSTKDIEWTVVAEGETEFVGYETMDSEVKVLKYSIEGEQIQLVLSLTPFYAESGGQESDRGTLKSEQCEIIIEDVRKIGADTVHTGKLKGDFDASAVFQAAVEASERRATMKNHTATHLLHKALQMILGSHVQQAGSLVNSERLRFDFSHFEKVKDEELKQVELIVNREIQKAVAVKTGTYPIEEAKEMGAMALFGEKYGDMVRVVEVPDFSIEFCGGTHVHNTGEIGVFKITGESSVASGIRRIEGLSGMPAFEALAAGYTQADLISKNMNINMSETAEKVFALQKDYKKLKKNAVPAGPSLKNVELEAVKTVGSTKVFMTELENIPNPGELRKLNDNIKAKEQDFVSILMGSNPGKTFYIAGVGKKTLDKIKAGDIAKIINKIADGKGGGKDLMAQGTCEKNGADVLAQIKEEVLKDL